MMRVKGKMTKENRNFILGFIGFMTALVFMIWFGSLGYYW
jgi:hypothetical protein